MASTFIDRETAIHETWKSFGADEGRTQDAAALLVSDFKITDGLVTHLETGFAIDDPRVRAFYQKTRPHLMPPQFEQSLADKAYLGKGNKTTVSILERELGKAANLKLAQSYGLDTPWSTKNGVRPEGAEAGTKKNGTEDHRNNPWSEIGWNVTKQGQCVRAMGMEKAAALAAACNSRIGATKPTKVA
jgi:hypothetical protein